MDNDAIGAGASGRRLGAAMLGLLHSHIELFGIELQEQKGPHPAPAAVRRPGAGVRPAAADRPVRAGAGAAVGQLSTGRIIGLCVFYGIAALYCGLRLKAAVFDESSPFSATLEELAKDRERLP
jgi:uncharacterized membrane protein YqjE